ncbi:ATP-dependent DNA helicase RecQ [Listeria floridensis FSL S10-1187]|uniref:DNA helicase RecQ n=1 Tax=Listeria floridensis FSL S10-1187 TaxID=1265817 RepID=A0ABP3AZZ4_9LIST|nr:DNA helicase RecQ [Listeria floridensis]EUJ31679.1 ATP-dependent DNA helicase RecQ [Listeria floridensis FSL S10-1187]
MIQQAQGILREQFGYESFRTGQEEVIGKLLQGEDTLAIMPTGGGKSLCYQIPALMFHGITIVVSPLISLMKDQVDALQAAGIGATFINSSLSLRETNERLNLIRSGSGDIKLLYIAPERLEAAGFKALLEEVEVSLFAIDEAHCISQWGHDFRPSYLRLCEHLNEMGNRPLVVALTATATSAVADDISELLGIRQENIVKTGFSRDNLGFQVVKGQDKDRFLMDYVKRNETISGIVYAATRKEVERLEALFVKEGVKAAKYHAGLSDAEREDAQEAFLYDDISVIVATNAFGMGIDKSNVRFVIHYNLPRNMEAYYQEAGRAGRDGLSSDCILLFSPQDSHLQHYLIEQSELSDERKENEFRKLRDMTGYGYTEICLQKYIVQYFGETREDCGKCSNCLDTREAADVTIEAQQVFSCVKRMGERFGKVLIAKVLTGSADQKVKQWRFDSLSTYGLMKNRSQKDVLQLIDYLAAEKFLAAAEGQFPSLHLTEKAVSVLRGELPVMRKAAREAQRITANVDAGLFELLREARRELASRDHVPPYIIFSDESLREMCRYLPQTEAEMLQIKGIGTVKLEKYGGVFLQILQNEKMNQ